MWPEAVVAWCHYGVLCMLWHYGGWPEGWTRHAVESWRKQWGWQVNIAPDFLSSEGCPPVVECSIFFQNALSPPPALPPTGFASLSLWESADLTHHDQYLVSHAWNRQMFGVSFSETGSFCWVKGINASFRLWGCRPTVSEGWLMRFLPAHGPLRFACLPGLSCPVSPLIQTLTQTSVQSKQLSWSGRGLDVKQQGCDWELICSFANCVSESESVVPSQLSAIDNNFFLFLFSLPFPCFPFSLSIYLCLLIPPTAPAAARERSGGWCLLLPLCAVQLLDQGQAQPNTACALYEAPTQWEPQEASTLAEGPARGGGRSQLHLHHPQMPFFRYRSDHAPVAISVCLFLDLCKLFPYMGNTFFL